MKKKEAGSWEYFLTFQGPAVDDSKLTHIRVCKQQGCW
jgi:hypothetical protein